jgi:hypothetical protein
MHTILSNAIATTAGVSLIRLTSAPVGTRRREVADEFVEVFLAMSVDRMNSNIPFKHATAGVIMRIRTDKLRTRYRLCVMCFFDDCQSNKKGIERESGINIIANLSFMLPAGREINASVNRS